MTGSVVAILNTSSQVALILYTHIDQSTHWSAQVPDDPTAKRAQYQCS